MTGRIRTSFTFTVNFASALLTNMFRKAMWIVIGTAALVSIAVTSLLLAIAT